MAIHLVATIYHVGEAAFHGYTGNAPAATAAVLKAGCSLIPGGGAVAHIAMGKMSDAIAGNTVSDADVEKLWDHRDDIVDGIKDSIDNMGDGDGIAELSDIFNGFLN